MEEPTCAYAQGYGCFAIRDTRLATAPEISSKEMHKQKVP